MKSTRADTSPPGRSRSSSVPSSELRSDQSANRSEDLGACASRRPIQKFRGHHRLNNGFAFAPPALQCSTFNCIGYVERRRVSCLNHRQRGGTFLPLQQPLVPPVCFRKVQLRRPTATPSAHSASTFRRQSSPISAGASRQLSGPKRRLSKIRRKGCSLRRCSRSPATGRRSTTGTR